VGVSCEEGLLVLAATVQEDKVGRDNIDQDKEDFAEYVRKELDDMTLDPEGFLPMEVRLPVQRFRDAFYSKTLATYRRLALPPPGPRAPLQPDIFQSTYGPHGIELIRVEAPAAPLVRGTRGVKVTGDPNIPFDKVTFMVDEEQCLAIPLEVQRSCRRLLKFHEQKKPKGINYQVQD
jgi:hypothetical protein